MARALAVQPRVLLLDEPFGALDAKVRKELRTWLRNLHHEVNVTTVFVTHDQEEAMEVADEIVIMNHGRVEQVGTAAEIYDNPASSFVMSFIGPVNVLPPVSGILPRHGKILGGDVSAANGAGDCTLTEAASDTAVRVFWRPQDVLIQQQPSESSIAARVERVIHLGWEIQVELDLETGQTVTAHLSREDYDHLQLQRHQSVYVNPRNVKVFSDYALSGR